MELKKIKKMTIVERARMLHELFPDEIPGLINYVDGMCSTILEDTEANKELWKITVLPFNLWLEQLKAVQNEIHTYREKLHQKSTLFADLLFDGYRACFLIDCLRIYISTQKHSNWKFSAMLEILFS